MTTLRYRKKKKEPFEIGNTNIWVVGIYISKGIPFATRISMKGGAGDGLWLCEGIHQRSELGPTDKNNAGDGN